MKKTLLISTALTLGVVASIAMPVEQARADDCLLDRDDDGNVDVGPTDNDAGANSNNVDARLACGTNAQATGSFGTAVGSESEASASEATAVGNDAVASASDATAIGSDALASGTDSTAVGEFARATGAFASPSQLVLQRSSMTKLVVPSMRNSCPASSEHLLFVDTGVHMKSILRGRGWAVNLGFPNDSIRVISHFFRTKHKLMEMTECISSLVFFNSLKR